MTPHPTPKFEACLVDAGTRFPNLVVGTDGTVILTHGGDPAVPPKPGQRLVGRRSADGGATWEDMVLIQEPAIQGGGMVVDDATGAIFAFSHREHVHPRRPKPPYPAQVYRSTDQGRSWQAVEATFRSDVHGNVPALHMAEHGIALHHGPKPGRLIRPARVWDGENAKGEFHTGYNTALFSDDRGLSWIPSAPFPSLGTGEGAIAELRDGTLLYSSRKQYFHEGEPMTSGRWFARSRDAGETWESPFCQEALPDGPRYRGAEKRGLNFNGHFGILAGLSRVPDGQSDILLYTSLDMDSHERKNLTVWASFDGGRTWPIKRLLFKGPAAYSTIVAGLPGTPSEDWIYCAFEGGENQMYEGVRLVRFNEAWLQDIAKT